MSRVFQIQTDFTIGEIDPQLRARIDIDQYYSALDRARNVVIQPQGGLGRRPGLKYIHTIPSGDAPEDGCRLIAFEFSVADSYMLLFVNDKMFVYRNAALVTNINGSGNDYLTTGIGSATLADMYFTQSADTLILVQEGMAPKKVVRGASSSVWTISTITFGFVPKHAFTLATSNPAVTLTPSAVSGNITLTASGSAFSSGSVGQYVEANDGLGRARIVRYTSGTVVDAVTELPFFSTTAIASGSWTLETGYEDVWSGTRGYPRSATFHQGRLWFGGTRDRPTTLYASRVNDFFNFNPGQAQDDEALEATISTDSLNAIVGIHSGRDLQVFSLGAEFSVPQVDLEPITPSNIAVKRGSNHGAKVGIRPQGSESGTLFIHRNGKALYEYQFSDVSANYVSNNLSLLSSSLLATPTDMALRKATSTDEGDLLLVVNDLDGSITAYSFLRSQKVIAPSLFTTSGTFENVGVDVTDIYVVAKRTINSATVYYVEKFDADFTTDAALQVVPANYGSPLVRGAAQSGTSLEIDALTAQPQPDDTFTLAGVTGTSTIVSATTLADDGTGTTFRSTLTLSSALASSPADNAAVTFTTVSETRNLTHLPSTTVKVIADDIVLVDNAVSASGVATIERPASSYIEFGIDYTVQVKTLPVETKLPSGPITGQKKRIIDTSMILDLTQNISVSSNSLSFRTFDSSDFDESVDTFTGVKSSGPLLGYSTTAALEFTQTNPLFFTLLGCEYKVSVGQ